MNGFQRRREQKKDAILQAALTLFMESGVQKVSVAQIAEKANVSQVTIFNYFESKDNLIQEVLKFYVDQTWDEQRELFDSDLPFKDKLQKMIFNESKYSKHIHDEFFQYLMKDYSDGKSYIEELYINEGIPRMIAFFNEGKEQGIVDPNVSDEAILIYIQMFNDFLQRQDVAKNVLPIAEDLTKLFFYGIVGKKED
ncbi:MAG: TetR/AcrR family transcriptional regulator [Lysinibacillus sp.]